MNTQQALLPLKVDSNNNSPEINFNSETGVLLIKGRSILENVVLFFEPILQWLDEYSNQPAEKTTLHIEMDYFNTSSSKFILEIFDKMQQLNKLNKKVEVIWYYNDDDSLELGKDYSFLLDVPFKFVDVA